MSKLGETLRSVLPEARKLGGGEVDKEALVSALDRLIKQLNLGWWIRVAAALVVFVILIFAAFQFLDQPSVLAAVFGAMGITFAGALAALKQVSDEMARVGMLLAIAPSLSLDALTEIARKLSEKI